MSFSKYKPLWLEGNTQMTHQIVFRCSGLQVLLLFTVWRGVHSSKSWRNMWAPPWHRWGHPPPVESRHWWWWWRGEEQLLKIWVYVMWSSVQRPTDTGCDENWRKVSSILHWNDSKSVSMKIVFLIECSPRFITTNTHTVVYFDSIPHTLSCCQKYSLAHQMCRNLLLKIVYNKCPHVCAELFC